MQNKLFLFAIVINAELVHREYADIYNVNQFVFGTLGKSSTLQLGSVCRYPQMSCQETYGSGNRCCVNTPGGVMLQTQFWDEGPSDSFTIHGIWPDLCNGGFEQFCPGRTQYRSVREVLEKYGQYNMIEYMDNYWLSNTRDNDDLWTHEFNKHGTCISTLDPSCIKSYSLGLEVVEYVNATISLFGSLDSFKALKEANIIPNANLLYNLSSIQETLKSLTGVIPTVRCNSGALKEVWYYFHVNGSIMEGNYKAIEPLQQSNCPCEVRYPPK